MNKRRISGLLGLLMVLGCMLFSQPMTARAETGAGGMTFVLSEDGSYALVSQAQQLSGSVSVPSQARLDGVSYPVKAIAVGAFRNSLVTSVTLPESLEWIGDRAFSFCPSLTSVDFSGAQVTLGAEVFENSPGVVTLSGTDRIVYVGRKAFAGTEWLANQSEDSSLYVGKCLYRGRASGDLMLPEGVLSIAPGAFSGQTGLTGLVTGDTLLYIGDEAFRDCTALSSVTFGASLETIGNRAFDGDGVLFGDIAFPASLSHVGAYAFRNCDGITGADFSATALQRLDNGVFYDCDALERVYLPETLTSVGYACFYRNGSLETVSAPGLTSIEYDAFRECWVLSDAAAFEKAEYVGTGAFDGTELYTGIGETVIGKAFYKCEDAKVERLCVAEGIKQLSPKALAAASSLRTLILPESLERVNEAAFSLPEEGTVYAFSRNSTVYEDLEKLSCGTLYLPEGAAAVPPENAVLMTGIVVTSLPDKTEYKDTDSLVVDGLAVAVITENGNVNTSQIGYAPVCQYDFSKNNIVTVSYGGFTTQFTVSIERTVLPGDLNGDGTVDSLDLLLMRRYLTGLSTKEDIQMAAADLDASGGVDSLDLLALRKNLAGL